MLISSFKDSQATAQFQGWPICARIHRRLSRTTGFASVSLFLPFEAQHLLCARQAHPTDCKNKDGKSADRFHALAFQINGLALQSRLTSVRGPCSAPQAASFQVERLRVVHSYNMLGLDIDFELPELLQEILDDHSYGLVGIIVLFFTVVAFRFLYLPRAQLQPHSIPIKRALKMPAASPQTVRPPHHPCLPLSTAH